MVVAVSSRPLIPSDSFFVLSSGRSCRVLPKLVRAFPVLSPLLLVWFCVKQDLLCLVFWALLFCCSTLSSFAGTWSFFWMLPLLSRLGNPSWPLANRRCYLLERILFLYWWFPLRLVLLLQFHRWAWMVFLQSGFWQWFCRPIRHLVILLAMRLLPPPGELWWSLETFGSSLSFDHWLVCVLVKRTGF